ncbi:MAG TPA: flagellar hook-length control protein FliK [Spirochaetota bacterium]|nr:flagellar hook-length control protein FliK [Spirochaetota bacterium]
MVDLIGKIFTQKVDGSQEFNKTIEKNKENGDIFLSMLDREIKNNDAKEYEDDITINVELETAKDIDEKKVDDKSYAEDKSQLTAFIVNIKNNAKNLAENNLKINKPSNEKSLDVLSNSNDKKAFKGEKNSIKINLSELDSISREKIRSTLKDMKSGKIDDKTANQLITQTLLNSGNENFLRIDKSKIAAIKIEKKDNLKNQEIGIKDNVFAGKTPEKEIKTESLIQKKELKTEEVFVQNKDEKNSVISDKNREKIKSARVKEVGLAEESKDGLKSELKFEINEIKSDIPNAKEKNVDIQKTFSDNRERIFDNIAKNTKIIQGNGETRFSTIFRPEELGRVDFKLNVKDGKFDGKLIVQNKESFDFFRNNIEDLKAVFQKSNVELGKLDIMLAGAGLNYGEDFSKRENRRDDNTGETFSGINYGKKIEKAFEENSMNSSVNYYSFNDRRINIFA